MAKNYFEILGIPKTASDLEIKSAYHRLARKYHPDKAETPEQATNLEAEFSKISTAYNTLKDKNKRAAYTKKVLEKAANSEDNENQNASSDRISSVSSNSNPSLNNKPSFGNAATDKNKATVAKRAFLRGNQMMSSGEYAKAAELFDMAIKNNDEEALYHARLALALSRSHRGFSRATEAAQKAIELDPYNSDFRLILAELYEGANAKSMAISTYEEILKWDPANEKAQMALDVLKPRKKNLLSMLFGRKP